jgi:hypothetical protein
MIPSGEVNGLKTARKAPGNMGRALLISFIAAFCFGCISERAASGKSITKSYPAYLDAEQPAAAAETLAGWSRGYVKVAEEAFTTLSASPAKGFALDEGGTLSKHLTSSWVIGSSDGKRPYLPFYKSDPASLPLQASGEYEVRFSYRIDETPDQGFETLFYSPTGGSKNDWLPTLTIKGAKGATGRGVLRSKLHQYSDYQVIWNVAGRGAIAINAIELVDVWSGRIVAKDDLSTVRAGSSPKVRIDGLADIPPLDVSGARRYITLRGPAYLRTVPAAFTLEPNRIYILEFDYRIVKRGGSPPEIAILSLYAANDPSHVRAGRALNAAAPDEGRFVGGIKTGSAANPYVLEFGVPEGTVLAVGELSFFEQRSVAREAAENPLRALSDAPFPRLGNYQGGFPDWIAFSGSDTVKSDLPLMSADELDRRLSLFDVVVGFESRTSTHDPAFGRRLRSLNPGIVLMPYTIAAEQGMFDWVVSQFASPLADPMAEFARGIDDSWWLRTSSGQIARDSSTGSWAAMRKLNISPFCPRNSQGLEFAGYFADRWIPMQLEDGSWDGLFIDNLFARTNPHILGAFDPIAFDADYNRNGLRDETLEWTHEMTAAASIRMLKALRDRFGDAESLIGNAGWVPELALAPYMNGFVFEGFNNVWYRDGDPGQFSEATWSTTLDTYRLIAASVRRPAVLVMEACGLHPGEADDARSDYRAPGPLDLHLQRLALGTALLGDGFYEYDLFDMRSAPIIFDEWCVDPGGASIATRASKGWLGAALGSAMELLADVRLIMDKRERTIIDGRDGKSLSIDCGRNLSGSSRQYVFEFDWEIADTIRTVVGLGFWKNPGPGDWTQLPSLVAGTRGHSRLHVTVKSGQALAFQVYVEGAGAVAITNLCVYSARGGIFRRDFSNGVVFVNATTEARELGVSELSQPLPRSDLRRILGRIDRATNNGKPVGGSLTIGPADAIVLRATHLEVPVEKER